MSVPTLDVAGSVRGTRGRFAGVRCCAQDQDLREQVTAFFNQHNPEKLDKLDGILFRYRGRGAQLMADLADKYKVGCCPPAMPASTDGGWWLYTMVAV